MRCAQWRVCVLITVAGHLVSLSLLLGASLLLNRRGTLVGTPILQLLSLTGTASRRHRAALPPAPPTALSGPGPVVRPCWCSSAIHHPPPMPPRVHCTAPYRTIHSTAPTTATRARQASLPTLSRRERRRGLQLEPP